jgi:dolichyl-phosphate beta-glucosyltransferase
VGDAPAQPRLSVVLPAYQEADRIGATVQSLRAALGEALGVRDVEIIVVDDGSADATAGRAHAAGADRVISHGTNRGKGAAVRTGALAAAGRHVAFTDADLAYAPGDVVAVLDALEAGADVAVGSRRHADTETVVAAPRLRDLGGRAINRLTRLVLSGDYPDTQCGLKGFRRDAAQRIFTRARIDGFAFDIEVLALAERARMTVVPVPVRVTNSTRSSVRALRDGLRLVTDLARIRADARRGHHD